MAWAWACKWMSSSSSSASSAAAAAPVSGLNDQCSASRARPPASYCQGTAYRVKAADSTHLPL
eukprot:1790610-Pleurochrysis_carterae.AAC.3